MDYLIYKYLHIIGLVFWLGGLFSLSSLVKFISNQDDENRIKLSNYARVIYRISNLLGMLLTIGSGVLLIGVAQGAMKSGWFHTKLTIIVVLLVFDHLLMRKIKTLSKEKSDVGILKHLHIIVSVIFFSALYLVIFKPF
jgi:putative membrane protein